MNLFESEEEKVATEKVLAAFKVKDINENIDTLVSDILKYAKEMDDLLEENNLTRRFLEKVSALSENSQISLDEDLNNIDFRLRERLEDLVKRINTRIELIKDNDANLKIIEQSYNLEDLNLEEEIAKAHLTDESFA